MRYIELSRIKPVHTTHAGAGLKRVLIDPGIVPHLTQFGQVVFNPGDVAKSHLHPDMSEIFLTDDGTGVINIDGKVYDIRPGICILVNPGEKHEITNTGKVPLKIYYYGIAED
jgi:mannose-6-phosphate isomerase-like protein (cupin superfamily)